MLVARVFSVRFTRVPLLIPVATYLVISTLSTGRSENVYLSLIGTEFRYKGLLSLSAGILLFYAAARFLNSWGKTRFFLLTGVLSAVIIAIYGITQRFGFDPLLHLSAEWLKSGEGVPSTLGTPIYLAAYLTLMLGAAGALYYLASSRWERVLWLSALGVMGVCLVFTYTRGALLGGAIALPVVVGLAHRRMEAIQPLFAPLAVLIASTLVAWVLSSTVMLNLAPATGDGRGREVDTSVSQRPVKALKVGPNVPEFLGEGRSVYARLLMWRDTIPVILERPLLGHGPDNFEGPFSRHAGDDLKAIVNYRPIDEAHNEFLQVAATTGLLGLASYIWIIVAYFRKVYSCGGWPLIALSAGLLAYIVQLQTAFTSVATGVTFWGILGVSVAVMRLSTPSDPRN
jgi:putative inorganic carbon (HCO3(-)) transporter